MQGPTYGQQDFSSTAIFTLVHCEKAADLGNPIAQDLYQVLIDHFVQVEDLDKYQKRYPPSHQPARFTLHIDTLGRPFIEWPDRDFTHS